MDLTRFVNDLQQHLEIAAAAGGPEAQELASRLLAPLNAATRLVLLESLSAAANEITREMAPGGVDIRLRGQDPEFVVTLPEHESPFTESTTQDHRPAQGYDAPLQAASDDGGVARTTLRLPEPLKLRMEAAANNEGVSVNSWLNKAVSAALEPQPRRNSRRDSPAGPSLTGWVQ